MKIHSINSYYQSKYNSNQQTKTNVQFKSKPSGETCTRLFRTNLYEFTNFVINHFKEKITSSKPNKIRIICHFGSDGSEIYSHALSLINELGYKKVEKKFSFESRDFNGALIKEAKTRKMEVRLSESNKKLNDFANIMENIGEQIHIAGQKLNIFNIFSPIKDKNITNTDFKRVRVHKNLHSIIKFKQENISDFKDKNVDIFCARNHFSSLYEGHPGFDINKIITNIHDGLNENGMFVISRHDALRNHFMNKCQKIFKTEPIIVNQDVVFIKKTANK